MSRAAFDLSVYLVTSSAMTGRDHLVATVLDAVAGGVSLVQLREPDAPDKVIVGLGRDLVAALGSTSVPLLINDRVHLVESIGAAGAHIGQTDLTPAAARAQLGPDRLLGLSVSTIEEAQQAERDGHVDYLGIGPVWPTATKEVARPALGPEQAGRIAAATALPCVAIGGIGVDQAALVRAAGLDGVAVVSAICAADDPHAEAARLRAAFVHGVVGAAR